VTGLGAFLVGSLAALLGTAVVGGSMRSGAQLTLYVALALGLGASALASRRSRTAERLAVTAIRR
jgi:hypothetical protein